MNPAGGKSKTLAAWAALLGGALGAHRFYLYGPGDPWGWAFVPPTLLGLLGVQRALAFGQEDRLSWILIPLLGLALAAAMLSAIVYALMPDERWNARHNGGAALSRTGWGAVIGAALALFIGAGVLMATVAFSGQRFFEYQALNRTAPG